MTRLTDAIDDIVATLASTRTREYLVEDWTLGDPKSREHRGYCRSIHQAIEHAERLVSSEMNLPGSGYQRPHPDLVVITEQHFQAVGLSAREQVPGSMRIWALAGGCWLSQEEVSREIEIALKDGNETWRDSVAGPLVDGVPAA